MAIAGSAATTNAIPNAIETTALAVQTSLNVMTASFLGGKGPAAQASLFAASAAPLGREVTASETDSARFSCLNRPIAY